MLAARRGGVVTAAFGCSILIADNLVVKVSDFGTSREWDDASAIMSFTGTVAWMAPEIIRHEPCSERVDVWSYGVVLWELLTQEVPYKVRSPPDSATPGSLPTRSVIASCAAFELSNLPVSGDLQVWCIRCVIRLHWLIES